MAKANLVLPDGAKVTIEGSAEEIALLLNRFSTTHSNQSRKRSKKRGTNRAGSKKAVVNRKGPTSLVTELVDEGYFKSKRSIVDIQRKLEEKGHIYVQANLSPALVRLTRRRILRRLKEKKGWAYVS